MSDERPRRPILSLKAGVKVNLPAFAVPAPSTWKCRPCGALVEVAHNAEGIVRCGACNARLGKAEDFLADPPLIEKLRAREAKKPPVAPAPRTPFLRQSATPRRSAPRPRQG